MNSLWDINEKLYYYVDNRDLKNVTKLLDEGANATKVTSFGHSAVGQATIKRYPDILQILLKSCEEEYISYSGGTPKKPRTENDNIEKTPDGMDALQWDDEIQANVNTPDDEWSRLYMYYARMFEQTGEILANTVRLKDPHCLDAYHQAPIHYAATLGYVDCLQILLDNGSPVDIIAGNGSTPLHLAGNLEVVKLLLKNKADPNRSNYRTGETALHVAARMGDIQMAELLLEAGADINATSNLDRTPLMTAINIYTIDIAYFLIRKGAKLNLQNHEGYTALYYSVVINNVSLTSYLLQCGARLFVTHYLLHFCVRNNYQDMAKLLIEAGENVNVQDFTGCTPLFIALKRCNESMVHFLLENGAQKFGRDDNVIKELHVVVQNATTVDEFTKVARVLLANDIMIDDYNYWCETPVLLAIMLEKYGIAEFLIKEGADVNKGRSENIVDTCLLARSTTNINLLILLVNAGLKLNPLPSNLKPPPWKNVYTDLEDWLAFTCRNPLSLQQLSRISIRNSLMKNIPTKLANTSNYSESRLKKLVEQTGLPQLLHKYLLDFNDLPKV